MKVCPVCRIEYKDEKTLFCINDGAPLLELEKPADNAAIAAETENKAAVAAETENESDRPPNRIKISINDVFAQADASQDALIAKTAPPPKQNNYTILLALLGVFVLFAGAAIGAALYYFSAPKSDVAQINFNAATNANTATTNNTVNTNAVLPLETNGNLNADANQNSEMTLNANAKPSPKPSPSPLPSIVNRNSNGNANQANGGVNTNAANLAPTPVSTRPPSAVVAASPATKPSVVVSGGIVNGLATSLPRPAYPPTARAVRASGPVNVQVMIDENGNVTSASAVSGHVLLRPAAVQAARQARFQPTIRAGQPVRTTGIIVYNFAPEP